MNANNSPPEDNVRKIVNEIENIFNIWLRTRGETNIGLFGSITQTQRTTAQKLWGDALAAQRSETKDQISFIRNIQDIIEKSQFDKSNKLHKDILLQFDARVKPMIDKAGIKTKPSTPRFTHGK